MDKDKVYKLFIRRTEEKISNANFTLIKVEEIPPTPGKKDLASKHLLTVQCNQGHITEVKACNFKGKCLVCSGKNQKTTEQFAEEVNSLTNGEYKLISEYINKSAKVTISHLECNRAFKVSPNDFLNKKNRCPFCNTNRTKQYSKSDMTLATADTVSEFFNINIIDETEEYWIGRDLLNSVQLVFKKKYISQLSIRSKTQRPITKYEFSDILVKENYEFVDINTIPTLIGDKEKYLIKHNECGHEYSVRYNHFHINGRRCPNCSKGKKFSNGEKEILAFIEELGIECIPNYRVKGKGKELDIFIPSLSIGIEYNGQYWHSERIANDKLNLFKKTEYFAEREIRVIHILSSEWLSKPDIVKSRIKYLLNKIDTRIPARKTLFKEIPSKLANSFLENNHIQGKDRNVFKAYGLFYNNDLVSALTYNNPRFITNNKDDGKSLEIGRFASSLDTNVIAGFSKLLKNSLEQLIDNYTFIYTYADMRWSTGGVYESSGFEFDSLTKPSYYYFRNDNELYHRSNFMKHKLSTKLETFDESLTEYQNMLNNGYDRLWDCGNLKYILDLTS
jgi:hypothetical protein